MGLTNTLVKLLANILEVEEHEIIFDKKISCFIRWDCVNNLRILNHVENEFNIYLRMEQYSKLQTIGELQELIKECQNEGVAKLK